MNSEHLKIETLSEAKYRNHIKIKAFRTSEDCKLHRLANKLERCRKGKRCCLPQHPLKRIIAIGIEPVKYSKTTSEDIAFIDCSQWTDEQQQRFRELRNIMKIWRTPLDKATKFQAKEYPDVVSKKVGRNDPCPCQSGKKYKKCCGR